MDPDQTYLTAQLRYEAVGGREVQASPVKAYPTADCSDMSQVEPQLYRCLFVDLLAHIHSEQDAVRSRAASLRKVNELASKIASSSSADDDFVKALMQDIQGQVTEALSRDDYLRNWGAHYLPSLKFAHQLQQCNNFKDPGVQMYGGDLFDSVREHADETFNKLPPPKPSAAAYRGRSAAWGRTPAPSAPVVSMAAYNDRYSG